MERCNVIAMPDPENLRIGILGRIDSGNANDFANSIKMMRQQHPEGDVILDCSGLEYISSAGLRVLLTLKKRENLPLKLIEVNRDVSSVLEVTGFIQIFDVTRALRDITGTEGEFLGKNGNVSFYQMESDTILKVFWSETPLEAVERERKNAQAALLAGIPTLIAYDIVKCNNCYGMLYEMIQAKNAPVLMKASPRNMRTCSVAMGKLLKIIHSSMPEPDALPQTRDIYIEWAQKMSKYYYPHEVKILLELINSVPVGNNFVYGNFTAKNVFIRGDEAMVLNMSGLSCGNALYDLGTCYMFHMGEAKLMSEIASELDVMQANILWRNLIRAYYDDDEAKVIASTDSIRAASMLRSALAPASYPMEDDMIEKFIKKARRDVFPAVRSLTNALSKDIT